MEGDAVGGEGRKVRRRWDFMRVQRVVRVLWVERMVVESSLEDCEEECELGWD